ncbi:DNA repair protein RecN [Gudongella sp. DL1XJH-153]|uniref:DNA repair protein RecN n=1 Tax=Gudongella sp. DL1XJH-153 TaxID=3409804 RepID=UPI003BB75053
MLKELRIRNFAIIDNLTIDFTEGLNLLTGETGSGKSIIIEALEMVLGGRASREMIRSGQDKAVIEAMFFVDKNLQKQLSEMGYEESDVLILTKEISEGYPSVSRINGRPLTLNVLKTLTGRMVDIFGQHEHQSLLDTGNHILIIDSLIPEEGKILIRTIREAYIDYRGLQKKLQELSVSSQERERELDLLKFQIDEIDAADLKEDDEAIEQQFKRLDNLKDTIAQSYQALALLNDDYESPAAISLIEKSIEMIGHSGRYDRILQEHGNSLQAILYELQELYRGINGYIESLDIDEEELFLLRERLDLVNTLKKKYGSSVEQILSYRDEIEERYNRLINIDKELEKLEEDILATKEMLLGDSENLSIIRKKVAEKLQKDMEKELFALNMDNVRFKVDFNRTKEPTDRGVDKVEFLISTNPGEDLKPLSKIISGGEMSRIMLAFKGILADMDNMPTLVFDEIDTGISGRTAQVVGEKIRRISKSHQVISISHLPQIAALADTHFVIRKASDKKGTITKVERLLEDERVDELARLLGGVEVTETTRKHANEMLQMSNRMKK